MARALHNSCTMPKPHRLKSSNYQGRVRVFITCCTQDRHAAFADPVVCEFVIEQLIAKTKEGDCQVLAYVLMPDHGHFLLAGTSRGSYLPTVIARWKQATAYWYARRAHRRLWLKNYWDHVLRDPDDARGLALYAVSDPIRSKLVDDLSDYRWWDCKCWDRAQLAAEARAAAIAAKPPALPGGHPPL
jgi:REP element-mobilizing transposase RayT